MNPGSGRYWGILSAGVAGAMFLCAQSTLAQGPIRPMPDGVEAKAAALAAQQEVEKTKMTDKKDRFTYGKRHETSVTTESTNAAIEKTKHGSSDATVPTGVFKESFMDVGLSSGRAPASSPTPAVQINPVRAATTAPQSSASPQPNASPAAPARIDITFGVSPAPTIAATPPPH